MSEPKRYAMTWATDEDEFVYVSPVESAEGKWVNYEDYARLKTEVQTLRHQAVHDVSQLGEQSAEIAHLKAEVERLKKPAVIGGYNLSEYIRMANSETLEFDNGDIFAGMTLPERIKYIVESHARLQAEIDLMKVTSQLDQRTIRNLHQTPQWSEIARLTADYRKLEVENSDLKAEFERLRNTDPNSISGSTIMSDPAWSIACFRFHRENERAEIARLRKAGDNLERVLTTKVASYEVANASHEWQSAKNYKPSV